ncbi:MAG TPA: D-glucuronyl C5-epimerase family protein [Ktedonosporobacter sp.]|jgi:glycosyltransferase involved in cell wall biosynthesis|nr:D-glucuronyl C5-epimerase family protein [Ktedonosporobacter sp.]
MAELALAAYPVDMSAALTLAHHVLDASGVPYRGKIAVYDPITIAQYALAHWNLALKGDNQVAQQVFLRQAEWLVKHEVSIKGDAGGWPIPVPNQHTDQVCLSASCQGNALSVLVRAYQLTCDRTFLMVARRVVRTFERDILDGGVGTPVGEHGVFFEDVAIYPAAHGLDGMLFALLGLYDYLAVTGNTTVNELIETSLTALHRLLPEFDPGFWTRADLLQRHLSTPAQLSLHVKLMEALATCTGCQHCAQLALKWQRYQQQPQSYLRYRLSRSRARAATRLMQRVRTRLFPQAQTLPGQPLRVCIPVTAFPLMGGVNTAIEGIAQVTHDIWRIEYLTQHVGPHAEKYTVRRFGNSKTDSWLFPHVWLYFFAGLAKLLVLSHRGIVYDALLPQDGVFTSAFAGLAGKLAGVRVICVDHGNIVALRNPFYRAERLQYLKTLPWYRSLPHRILLKAYWPSLQLFARLSARLVDHFLIPGAVGDGVEDLLAELDIPASRVTRTHNSIDIDRHVIPDNTERATIRQSQGIAADTIVVTMICRLAPEKGIEIALQAFALALSELTPELRARVCFLIVGDGPIRKQIEGMIVQRGMNEVCRLWGEASSSEVIMLLGMSDIFLYTSWRGTGYPLAILEAMASGCAVIASTEPYGNVQMLADGRGLTVSIGDVMQTKAALLRLLQDMDECHRMGQRAREYVAQQQNPTLLRRVLMRATTWSGLQEIITTHTEIESATINMTSEVCPS